MYFEDQAITNSPAQSPTAPAAQQASPLDNLKDIRLPENIDQFPSAIGWWILLALVILVVAYFIYRAIKKHRALRFLRLAKIELSQLASLPENKRSSSDLSSLLKRVCLMYFPRENVAPLNGYNWWNYLNEKANKTCFEEKDIERLVNSRYQKNTSLSEEDWNILITKTEKCIDSIVRIRIKKKTKSLDKNKPNQLVGVK